MFLLRLTSDNSLHGMETDDGFIIGRFARDTIFLLGIGTVVGAFGGLIYLGLREWLPRPWRALAFGLLGAAVGGAIIIEPDGLDFTLIEPRLLAVLLFIALPASCGVLISVLAERFLRAPLVSPTGWRWLGLTLALIPLAMVLFMGLPGIVILILITAELSLNRSGRITRLWRSRAVTGLGRLALGSAIALGSFELTRNMIDVL